MNQLDCSYLNELNEMQRKAVEYCDGPSLVIASAGSGKTRVLTYKIAHLINIGYEPWNIMALTFTNKAANVMKERIDRLIGEGSSKNIWMGTFHSVFLRILRYEHQVIGFSSNFTIYDQADSESLLKSIIREEGLDDKIYKSSAVLNRISMAKSRLISPSQYMANTAYARNDTFDKMPAIGKLYEKYTNRCRQANSMDFDDILFYTFDLFRNHPEIKDKYASRFKYVLVDEYQDTNYAQHAIVYQLTSVNKKLCVVGDDAQSIYSFRGASINNILKFNEAYPGYKLFKLEQNYRSTKNIVSAANSVIEKNEHRIKKTAFSENEGGNLISLYQTASDIEEGYAVANKIKNLHEREHLDFSSFAILYRTNSQSRIFEEALRKQEFPYVIYGGLSFYKRKEIKDVIAYFRLVINHNDEEAFKRVVNYPTRGIGSTTIKKIIDIASTTGKGIWNVISAPGEMNLSIAKKTMEKISEFKTMIEGFEKKSNIMNAYEVGREIIITSGISGDLYKDMSVEGKSRQENLEELVSALHSFTESKLEEGESNVSLVDYLSEVSLMSDIDEDKSGDNDCIKLMTIHSAKGLEFHTVFIVGVEEDLFPSAKAKASEADIEEERRLFYVAITRAEKNCFISYATNRYRFGKAEFAVPSRFINEIDRKYIRENKSSAPQPKIKQRSYANIFSQFRQNSQENLSRPSIQADEPQRYKKINKIPDNPYKSTTASHTEETKTNNRYHLSVGDRISHDRFGNGVVEKIEGNDENCKATVLFDNMGRKQLLLKYAHLTIIK